MQRQFVRGRIGRAHLRAVRAVDLFRIAGDRNHHFARRIRREPHHHRELAGLARLRRQRAAQPINHFAGIVVLESHQLERAAIGRFDIRQACAHEQPAGADPLALRTARADIARAATRLVQPEHLGAHGRIAGEEDDRRLHTVDPGKLFLHKTFRAEGLCQRLPRGILPDEAVRAADHFRQQRNRFRHGLFLGDHHRFSLRRGGRRRSVLAGGQRQRAD